MIPIYEREVPRPPLGLRDVEAGLSKPGGDGDVQGPANTVAEEIMALLEDNLARLHVFAANFECTLNRLGALIPPSQTEAQAKELPRGFMPHLAERCDNLTALVESIEVKLDYFMRLV